MKGRYWSSGFLVLLYHSPTHRNLLKQILVVLSFVKFSSTIFLVYPLFSLLSVLFFGMPLDLFPVFLNFYFLSPILCLPWNNFWADSPLTLAVAILLLNTPIEFLGDFFLLLLVCGFLFSVFFNDTGSLFFLLVDGVISE